VKAGEGLTTIITLAKTSGFGKSIAPPPLLSPVFDEIPAQLKRRAQWVVWRPVWDASRAKFTKPPLQPNGLRASHSNPRTWVSFEAARDGYQRGGGWGGVGYVLTEDDSFTGIDLDHVVDLKRRTIAGWALALVKRLNSYSEVSPSGTGIRIFIAARLRGTGRKRSGLPLPNGPGAIEIYDRLRFLTTTGRRIPSAPTKINRRQRVLDAVVREFFPQQQVVSAGIITRSDLPPRIADKVVLEIANAARNGAEFKKLYDGDIGAAAGDHSGADFRLMRALLFYSGGNVAQAERLFSASALARRDKWQRRADYRERTIANALAGMTDFYDPSYNSDLLLRLR